MRGRLTDADRNFGPFTWGPSGFGWKLCFSSEGGEDDGDSGNSIYVNVPGWVLRIALPRIIRPYREKVKANFDAATVARLGRDWYYQTYAREYSIGLFDGDFLIVRYGLDTGSSLTTQSKGWFLPWKGHTHIEHRFYDCNLMLMYTVRRADADWIFKKPTTTRSRLFSENESSRRKHAELYISKRNFTFADFDGETIVATTFVDEREWAHGTGWFRWLRLFRRNLIRRSLEIHFSAEVGARKGSWKGGTIAHSIDMLNDRETHKQAFERYCAENKLTFLQEI